MDLYHNLINAILVIVALYALAVHLRNKGHLTEKHSLVLARIVTDLCLPSVVFISLAKTTIQLSQILPSLVMLLLELSCIALAWIVSVMLRFSKAQQGAIVFCAAFGSSTFLGYSIIMQMFPDTPQALSEAVIISEIGVGYPIFILGPLLGAYFGTTQVKTKDQWKASLGFFKSPVFFALISGLLWGHLNLPTQDNLFAQPLFRLCTILASALTPLAILSVGLMFKIPKLKSIIIPLVIVVLIKLILKPIIAGSLSALFGFPEIWKEVLILLAAMPPAVLGAVFLRRYGGDASLASALLLTASLISSFTLIGVFWAFN